MGEDRTPCVEKRSSAVSSSCSEEGEARTEEEQELEYGPGIVHKLRTRFLTISLKQNRGSGMRRSCSMENLLEQQGPPLKTPDGPRLPVPGGELKRAKSMDTLLMDLQQPEQRPPEGPKVVRRPEGPPSICDDELPKPDTVKTYKRIFEPAEARRGSHCRRPPVLRASAKSGASKTNGLTPGAKMNGKLSAKQPPASKKPLPNGPTCNGIHTVKATPIKISDLGNGKEQEMNELNLTLSMKELDRQCNGTSKEGEQSVKSAVISNCKPKVPPNRPTFVKNVKPAAKLGDVQKISDKRGTVVSRLKSNFADGGKKPKQDTTRNDDAVKVKKDVSSIINKLAVKTDSNGMNGLENKVKKDCKIVPTGNKKKDENNLTKVDKKSEATIVINKNEGTLLPANVDKSSSEESNKKCEVSNDRLQEESILINGTKSSEQSSNLNWKKIETAPDIPNINQSDKLITSTEKPLVNGFQSPNSGDSVDKTKKLQTDTITTCVPSAKLEDSKPAKKAQSSTSMVFDFRGKDVVPHVAVLPVPFGCKAMHPKKRPFLIDGKEGPVSMGSSTNDDEDEDYVDYSVPVPCGVVFEGENIKVGKGSILSTRNKDLRIKFDEDIDANTFIYPSESSLLEDEDSPVTNGQPPKFKTTTPSGAVAGLSSYTPSVLRALDAFRPGMFRPPDKEENYGEEKENEPKDEEEEMLKPADPGLTTSWSLSAGTSDLLF